MIADVALVVIIVAAAGLAGFVLADLRRDRRDLAEPIPRRELEHVVAEHDRRTS